MWVWGTYEALYTQTDMYMGSFGICNTDLGAIHFQYLEDREI